MRIIVAIVLFSVFGFVGKSQILFSDSCDNETVSFSADTANVDSLFWNFGDPTTGVNDTSTNPFPNHLFSDTGQFSITLVRFIGGAPVLSNLTVRIYPKIQLELGSNLTICQGDPVLFNVAQPYSTYLWHDGSLDSVFTALTDTLIKVTVTGVCDTLSDSVEVFYDQAFNFNLGPDTNYCLGQTIELDAEINVNANFLWNTGQLVDSVLINKSGIYILQAQNVCDTIIDSVQIGFLSSPDSNLLPNDTVNCFNNSILLSVDINDSIDYLWVDGSTGPTFSADSSQTVWVNASNICGSISDTIKLTFNEELLLNLGVDTVICDEDSIPLRANNAGATYVWSTGDTAGTIFTNTSEEFYSVTVTNGGCSVSQTIRVELNDVVCKSIECSLSFNNVFSPNGDGINDLWRATSDCFLSAYDLSIYDRWGQIVHRSSNINFGWDGYIKGEKAASGTYFFTIRFKDNVIVNVDREVFQGSFTLIR